MDPPYGAIVTIPQGRGVVRFKGPTSFMSTGKWIGIELYEKNGKNDGSVDGISYFNCELGYGVFVRPSQIRSIHGSELDAGPSVQKPPPPTGRPAGMGHQRLPSTGGLSRTGSIKRSDTQPPSPAGRSSGLGDQRSTSAGGLLRTGSIKPQSASPSPKPTTLSTRFPSPKPTNTQLPSPKHTSIQLTSTQLPSPKPTSPSPNQTSTQLPSPLLVVRKFLKLPSLTEYAY
jgi:dynactin 1